jgi:hypothetical protein
MVNLGGSWDGDAWQDYCNELLALHHPDAYQVIPAADRGDCGLEGHSTDGSGCAYQCYAADEEIAIPERRSRQVRKITATVTTLIEQRGRLGRVVGVHRIQRLIFLFPRHDSANVNEHLRCQEARLRAAVNEHAIKCIMGDVTLATWTVPPYLATERAMLDSAGGLRTALPQVAVDADQIADFREQAADALVNGREKLARRFGDDRARPLMDVQIEDRLRGSELERQLEARPTSFERYELLKSRERRDITRVSAEGETAGMSLQQMIDRLREQMQSEVPGIHPDDASTLAAGAVADWLIECPLDFPEPQS